MSNLKMRALARFPVSVSGTGGIGVEKVNGEWTIFPDFGALDEIIASAIGDPTTKDIWIWDPVTDVYNTLTLAGLGDALYKATSTTSLAIGTGSKTFVTQSGKDFGVGSFIIATSDADPTDFMLGQVTSYSGTSLVVNVSTVGGSGTDADWTIRASASAGSAGRSAGFLYSWSTDTTSTDPTSGKVKINNAAFASATAVFISETDADSNALAAEIATWDDSTSTIRGRLKIYNQVAPANFVLFDVTGTNTDNGTWDTLNVTYIIGAGSFSASDSLRVQFIPKGDIGTTGATGTAGTNAGIKWLWDTSTSMADPGTGDLRLNNATLASVTAAAVSATNAESGNPSVAAYLLTVDDSTTTAHRGHMLIKKILAPQNFALYDITGALVDNTTWVQLVLTHVASSGSFSAADPLAVTFYRTGDAGAGAGDMLGANNLAVGAGGVANAATSRTNLGLGTAAVQNVGAFAQVANNLSDVTAATAFTNIKQAASDTATGVVELATVAEVTTGTDTARACTPAGVAGGHGAGLSSVRANKNGSDQTGVADSTVTAITFGTEVYDVGSNFATNAWTPPAGKVSLKVAAFITGTIAAGNLCALQIKKDGATTLAQGSWFAGADQASALVSIDDVCTGSNVYTAHIFIDVTSGTATVNGTVGNTYFCGHMIT